MPINLASMAHLSSIGIIMNKNIITLAMMLALGGCGSDNKGNQTTFSGISEVTIDNTEDSFSNGTSSHVLVKDNDEGEEAFVAQLNTSTTYGIFSIATFGEWSYQLDASKYDFSTMRAGDTLTDTIAINSVDGSQSTITITIVEEQVGASLSGDLTATVAKDSTQAITGTISINDENFGEDEIEVETDLATNYGSFSIDAAGAWVYTLDTTNETVAALIDPQDSLTDTITISSADGTTAEIEIGISLIVGEPAADRVAAITNTFDGDSGELRYEFSSPIALGKVTFSFLKEVTLNTTDGSISDGIVTLFADSNTTNNALLEMYILEDSYELEDDQGDIAIATPFVPNEWTDVEITWDATNATEDVLPLMTVTINGTPVTASDFLSGSNDASRVDEGMETIKFRLGANGDIIPDAAFFIDDIALYSDIAGTSLVWSEDFEDYDVGHSITDADSPNDVNIPDNEVIIHGNTIEVAVELSVGNGKGIPE